MKIIDNESHYELVGSAHNARPTSAGCSNYSTSDRRNTESGVTLVLFSIFVTHSVINGNNPKSKKKNLNNVTTKRAKLVMFHWPAQAVSMCIKPGELALSGAFSMGPSGKCTFSSFSAIDHWAMFL